MQSNQLMDTGRRANPEDAIFDNGDLNSRNNKYVAQIQQNDNLSAEEKEKLLKNHEANLNSLSGLMDADKKRQEQELDRILKERLERRRKLKEKQFAKEIKEETKEAEKAINGEFDKKQEDFIQKNKDNL
jgi:valyl-tRNA synthetase